MKIITFEDISKLNIPAATYYEWIDYPLRNRNSFILPIKQKIPMEGDDYCNIMPCAFPSGNVLGLKVVNRNTLRRTQGDLNLDSQIMLYSYDTCELIAILDGNFITTVRTAAVAVHSIINMVKDYQVVSMIGLGNIGTMIGEILFPLIEDRNITIKLYRYKNQAEAFIKRFKHFSNISFSIVDSYEDLMRDSDLILSCVTNAISDFTDSSNYKTGCTILPVHMKGFMECDKVFDNIVVSDLERAKYFKYYKDYKRLLYTDDILAGKVDIRRSDSDRTLIYNLGLAITDIYFAKKIFEIVSLNDNESDIIISPRKKLYV